MDNFEVKIKQEIENNKLLLQKYKKILEQENILFLEEEQCQDDECLCGEGEKANSKGICTKNGKPVMYKGIPKCIKGHIYDRTKDKCVSMVEFMKREYQINQLLKESNLWR